MRNTRIFSELNALAGKPLPRHLAALALAAFLLYPVISTRLGGPPPGLWLTRVWGLCVTCLAATLMAYITYWLVVWSWRLHKKVFTSLMSLKDTLKDMYKAAEDERRKQCGKKDK